MLLLVRLGRWELQLHNERDDQPAEDVGTVTDMPQPMAVWAPTVGFLPPGAETEDE